MSIPTPPVRSVIAAQASRRRLPQPSRSRLRLPKRSTGMPRRRAAAMIDAVLGPVASRSASRRSSSRGGRGTVPASTPVTRRTASSSSAAGSAESGDSSTGHSTTSSYSPGSPAATVRPKLTSRPMSWDSSMQTCSVTCPK
jgi:hypothetical protein